MILVYFLVHEDVRCWQLSSSHYRGSTQLSWLHILQGFYTVALSSHTTEAPHSCPDYTHYRGSYITSLTSHTTEGPHSCPDSHTIEGYIPVALTFCHVPSDPNSRNKSLLLSVVSVRYFVILITEVTNKIRIYGNVLLYHKRCIFITLADRMSERIKVKHLLPSFPHQVSWARPSLIQ